MAYKNKKITMTIKESIDKWGIRLDTFQNFIDDCDKLPEGEGLFYFVTEGKSDYELQYEQYLDIKNNINNGSK